jgi:hypothetical protein
LLLFSKNEAQLKGLHPNRLKDCIIGPDYLVKLVQDQDADCHTQSAAFGGAEELGWYPTAYAQDNDIIIPLANHKQQYYR